MQERLDYTEEEQREIIQLAARLQRDAGTMLSAREITEVAAEAGIEPRFVHEAIQRLSRPSAWQPDRGSPALAVLLPILLVFQFLGFFSMMDPGSLVTLAGLQWWLLFGVSLALGCVSSWARNGLLKTLGLVLGCAILVGLCCGGFVRLVNGWVEPNWPSFAMRIVACELIAAFAGRCLGGILEFFSRRTRHAVSQ